MSRAPVVSNTTPIITLVGVGLLDLLPQLYGQITIPRQVVTEYQVKAQSSDPDLEQLPWLVISENLIIDPNLPLLDSGEAATITLARMLGARFIMIDEMKARRVAVSLGLQVVGTLGVLLRAKQLGLLPAIGPVVEMMRTQGRWFSEALISSILSQAGE